MHNYNKNSDHLITPSPEFDFSGTALQYAKDCFRDAFGKDPERLILSFGHTQRDILEIIFSVYGSLSIIYEICYSFPRDSWMICNDDGNVMYFRGV